MIDLEALKAKLLAWLQAQTNNEWAFVTSKVIDWAVGLGLTLLALLLAIGLHRMIFRFLVKQADRKAQTPIAQRLRRPTRAALLVGVAELCIPLLPLSDDVSHALYQIATVVLIAALGFVVLAILNTVSDVALRKYDITIEDNWRARKHQTQIRVLRRSFGLLVGLLTFAAMFFAIPEVRQYGVSLFASAGVAGLVVGIAARPVLSNLIAGFQIAFTQPIRIEDAVLVEGEWGWIEEITATYVVVRIWDWRRLIVPLTYFVENPFQNWTRESGSIIGAVSWHLDYRAPVQEMREKLTEFLDCSDLWDHNVNVLQVIDTDGDSIHLRALMSAKTSPVAWDLRCSIREQMVAWLQHHHPQALPRVRAEMQRAQESPAPFVLETSNDQAPDLEEGARKTYESERDSERSKQGADT